MWAREPEISNIDVFDVEEIGVDVVLTIDVDNTKIIELRKGMKGPMLKRQLIDTIRWVEKQERERGTL